jgi:PadR family transcriptional regulator PadR
VRKQSEPTLAAIRAGVVKRNNMADQLPNDKKTAATIPAKRITIQMYVVLATLLSDPARERWGFELADATGQTPGTVYPILARLGEAGLVVDRHEDVVPGADRPPRRYWRLNPAQLDLARAIVTEQAARYRKTFASAAAVPVAERQESEGNG